MKARISVPPMLAKVDDFIWKDWLRQLQNFLNAAGYAAYAGAADSDTAASANISITLPPTDALVDGQAYTWVAATTSGGAAYTLNINSLGAQPLVTKFGVAPAAGDIQANAIVVARWNASQTRFELGN